MKKVKENKTNETKFYSLNEILKINADYNIIFGERSNGKTYAALEYALTNYINGKGQTAYVRRWQEDFKGKRAESLFSGHVQNGFVSRVTDGKFNSVLYSGKKWYLSFYDSDKNKHFPDSKPFCYGFCLSESEHDKSTSYPEITTVVFDEFLTRRYYLPDEFMIFMNVLSTIIRQRENVKIFMLGNTVNKYCPYFAEMGLNNIGTMQQGSIDLYSFGENGCKIAVEYAATINEHKPSNKYFCFDNQKLQMITGGKWELALYPHLPEKYAPKDVIFVFYIVFNDTILQCNVINKDNADFIYIHPKTTEIKDTENSLIYSLIQNGKPNYKRKLLSTLSDIEKRITTYFARDKVFYQSNEIGEIVRNYIKVSAQNNLIN